MIDLSMFNPVYLFVSKRKKVGSRSLQSKGDGIGFITYTIYSTAYFEVGWQLQKCSTVPITPVKRFSTVDGVKAIKDNDPSCNCFLGLDVLWRYKLTIFLG